MELFADGQELVHGLKRASVRLKAFGESVRNMGLKLAGLGVAASKRGADDWEITCRFAASL